MAILNKLRPMMTIASVFALFWGILAVLSRVGVMAFRYGRLDDPLWLLRWIFLPSSMTGFFFGVFFAAGLIGDATTRSLANLSTRRAGVHGLVAGVGIGAMITMLGASIGVGVVAALFFGIIGSATGVTLIRVVKRKELKRGEEYPASLAP